MTKRQAEKIIGQPVAVNTLGCFPLFTAETLHPYVKGEIVPAVSRTESKALGDLVQRLYIIYCNKVFTEQEWKCARCGKRKPLHGHHKKHRSKGRVDKDNLEGLCAACHGREHGG